MPTSLRSTPSTSTLLHPYAAAQHTEHTQRQRLHASASSGDLSLFDLEMRALSLSAHGPTPRRTPTPTTIAESPTARGARLDQERLHRGVLLALAELPVVPGLVHPLDSARANIALSRPWPRPEGRTVGDEKWMWEVLRYWARWPVVSCEPLRVVEEVVSQAGEGRRGALVKMRSVIGRIATGRKRA